MHDYLLLRGLDLGFAAIYVSSRSGANSLFSPIHIELI